MAPPNKVQRGMNHNKLPFLPRHGRLAQHDSDQQSGFDSSRYAPLPRPPALSPTPPDTTQTGNSGSPFQSTQNLASASANTSPTAMNPLNFSAPAWGSTQVQSFDFFSGQRLAYGSTVSRGAVFTSAASRGAALTSTASNNAVARVATTLSPPFVPPAVPGSHLNLSTLPYDVLHIICDHIVALYPSIPSRCSKGRIVNRFTNVEEEVLELNSGAFYEIVQFLNADKAHRDMKHLAMTCKNLKTEIGTAMEQISTVKRLLRPICIYQIWFEDLSWLFSCLNDYGCSNITTMRFEWDNRQRLVGSIHAPSEHRTEDAAPLLFDRIRHHCHSLTSLYVKVCVEWLLTRLPDGSDRQRNLKSWKDINGRNELKALVQHVRSKTHGQVMITLSVEDYGWIRWSIPQKQAFVQWLDDGQPVNLKGKEVVRDD